MVPKYSSIERFLTALEIYEISFLRWTITLMVEKKEENKMCYFSTLLSLSLFFSLYKKRQKTKSERTVISLKLYKQFKDIFYHAFVEFINIWSAFDQNLYTSYHYEAAIFLFYEIWPQRSLKVTWVQLFIYKFTFS